MNRIVYGLTEEKYERNGESRISYGIAAYADADMDGSATVVAEVCDIGNNKEKITELVDLCNKSELSIIHLYDVVEDYLFS